MASGHHEKGDAMADFSLLKFICWSPRPHVIVFGDRALRINDVIRVEPPSERVSVHVGRPEGPLSPSFLLALVTFLVIRAQYLRPTI